MTSHRAPALALAATLLALLGAAPARAQIMQPTGETIPSLPGCSGGMPTGLLPVFACICEEPGVCNIGATCPTEFGPCDDGMNGTCESRMFHVFNDNSCIPSMSAGLDVRLDARTTPETFSPTCGLTFTVESRGTALFRNAFGWYNATGAVPAASDLHVMLDCSAAEGDSVVLDLRSDPAYLGGEIGFFLLTPESRTAGGTCAGGDCCASVARLSAGEGRVYYSERDLNPDPVAGGSLIHLLVYDSEVRERKFYFAWEDTFGTANNDFTDLVTSVEGVECAGGGTDCATGRPGACARGVNRCEGDVLTCVASFDGEAERCDGLDNDCDGTVDDDVTCAGAGEVCHEGACVPPCELGVEFPCPLTYDTCDPATLLCVEPACEGVTCAAGETCRAGTCTSECGGIVCPRGLDCVLDRCVDACEGVSCASGSVCRLGVCVPGCNQCNGVVCGGATTCDAASGECADPSCAGGCAAGTYCDAGTCRDACEGAVCPRGERCEIGRCVPIAPGAGTDGGAAGADAGGGGLDGGTAIEPERRSRGCSCRAAGLPRPAPRGVGLALAGLLMTSLARRRARVPSARRDATRRASSEILAS